jgi:hypothetical protein
MQKDYGAKVAPESVLDKLSLDIEFALLTTTA